MIYTVVVTYDIEASSADEALNHPIETLNLPLNTEIQVELLRTLYLKGGEEEDERQNELN